MTVALADDQRSAALDAFLARQAGEGFRVETRSDIQAVIVRKRRLHFVLRRFAHAQAENRLVVSVDEHGEIEQRPAEPLRW